MLIFVINIIDVGLGNVGSVEHWLDRSNLNHQRVSRVEAFSDGAIIIPGVASAKNYMNQLRNLGIDSEIVKRSTNGQKIIGICLGFQILTEYSEEDGGVECLGILAGSASYIGNDKTHNGWAPFYLDSRNLDGNKYVNKKNKKIIDGRVYFNHELKVELCCSAYSKKLENNITSFAIKNNIFGLQFHPEKSQTSGQEILELII